MTALEVLAEVREIIRGTDMEHVWMNAPNLPSESLGERIDKVLAERTATPAVAVPDRNPWPEVSET